MPKIAALLLSVAQPVKRIVLRVDQPEMPRRSSARAWATAWAVPPGRLVHRAGVEISVVKNGVIASTTSGATRGGVVVGVDDVSWARVELSWLPIGGTLGRSGGGARCTVDHSHFDHADPLVHHP